MRVSIFAHEMPRIIAAHEKEAKRRFFTTKREKEGHRLMADSIKSELTSRFPELLSMPFDEWEKYLVGKETSQMSCQDTPVTPSSEFSPTELHPQEDLER